MKMTVFAGMMMGLMALSLRAADPDFTSASTGALFQLPPLPYATNALEPHISARTLSFHYGKHHQGYVDNLNKKAAGTPYAGKNLETVIRESKAAGQDDIFNNAAQVWNHTFNWSCMKPGGGGQPTGPLMDRIQESFGGYDAFRKAFAEAAVQRFGSGYIWLLQDGKKLVIETTSNAETPIATGKMPLLTCDLWEHAYYLDYQNRRKDYAEAFLDHLANWDFVQTQLK